MEGIEIKRLLYLVLVSVYVVLLFGQTVSAEEIREEDMFISTAFVREADCSVTQMKLGEDVIILSQTELVEQIEMAQKYKMKVVLIFPDSEVETNRLKEEISLVKQSKMARGQGTYTDEGWYHGSSVCVMTTLSYYTTTYNNLTYGGISSVYVQCSVSNSTILDDISLSMHQEGFALGGGREAYDETYDVSNRSTTEAPSSWKGVYWAGGVGSLVGARVQIKVHRGISDQYIYTFTSNIIE